MAVLGCGLEVDLASSRGELDRVGQQVHQHPVDLIAYLPR
jgi:hypothetical protein